MASSDKSRPRPRRLRRAVLWMLALVVLAVAFGPTIVMKTPLLSGVIADAIPPEAGSLSLASAGGGWLTPISAQGVELRDANGQPVFQAAEVKLSQNLIALLSGVEAIKMHVDRPVVNLAVRPDGSNLQDLIAAIERAKPVEEELTPPGATPEIAGRPLAALSVAGGTVYVTDATTGGRWTHQGINLNVDLTGGLSKLEGSARLGSAFNQFEPIDEGEPAPNIHFALAPAEGQQKQVALELRGVPLNAAEPFARRADPQLRLTGAATGRGQVAWTPPPPGAPHWVDALAASGLTSQGSIAAEAFAVQSRLLGGDTLRLSRVEAPWSLRVNQGRLELVDASVASQDVGAVRVRGVMSPDELKAYLAGGAETLRQSQRWPVGRVAADIDLARLAQLAPRAVALREDVRPVSGRLTAQLETEANAGAKVTGSVTATELVAEAAGQRVGWQQPFTLTGTVSRPEGLLTIEALRCESEFLYGDLSGSLADLNGNLGFDLDKLSEQVGQFVDLSSWQLSGKGNSTVRVEQTGPATREATLIAAMTNVMVARRGEVYLEEQQLDGSVAATVGLDANQRPAQLTAGRAALKSDADLLEVNLAEPVRLDAPAAAPLTASLKGDLTSWQNRLRVALAPLGGGALLGNVRLAGAVDTTTSARLGGGVLQLTGLDAKIKDLQVDGLGLAVREPLVTAAGDVSWDAATGTLESRQGELRTSSLTLASQALRAVTAAGQPAASGSVAVRADLARLNNWFVASDRPQAIGQVQGTIEFTQNQGVLRAALRGGGTGVAFLDAATKRPLLEEPQLTVNATAAYAAATEQLTIESATITSNTLTVQANGGVQDGASQFAGTIDYDLTALAPVIAGYVGPAVRVTGKHTGRFNLARTAPAAGAAPLPWSRAWQGRLEAPWSSINLFGLPIGPGTLGVTLANGEAKLDPLNLAVSGGTFTPQLSARLDPPPAVWGAAPGPVLTSVQVTPEISNQLLKYIAPVVADATRTQGVLSLQLESAGGPLDPLLQLSAAGRLDAQSVLVTPGATMEPIVRVVQQVEGLIRRPDARRLFGTEQQQPAIISIDQQSVAFRIDQGRVFHDKLTYKVGGVTIYSSGSVGFDQTLDYTITVPIQDDWIGSNPLVAGFRGQLIQFPIKGSFENPKLDARALENLARTGVRGLLDGGLKKLFGE
ncbi:hypothetical protein KOR34_48040 [Posidoniimonas corsicana]|uniref:Uncharacterized protein n=1 Tax=Posidoniimonas corsicana TaxID=1938618 RepID=A0A5C5UV45_9BACT|nr:hypothetical protein [Posidoniimonas corsicana]TWT30246.1 hypothetical protein KOR34_48040 [Posidoniimonas corsicana]